MPVITPLESVLFVALPYLAMGLFLVGTIARYRRDPFTFSSLSSQFLENRTHFWAQVPFHYGLLLVLAGHLAAFFFPQTILSWNAAPFRLYLLEITGLALAILAFVGLVNIVVRRIKVPRSRVVTSTADWVLYGLLALQIGTGIWTAVSYPWGSSWFATLASPYLWSLVEFSPDASTIVALPLVPKLHILGLWVLLGFFPFTRLVHVLVVPNPYLWRRPQVVRWYGIRRGKHRERA